MIESGLPAKSQLFGAHCRDLSRGAVGDLVDGRSHEGCFLRERGLLEQLGGEPSFTQCALIRRVTQLMLATEKLRVRFSGAEVVAPGDAVMLGRLNGALLDVLRDLVLGPPLASHRRHFP